jgi:hypothetical protein
MGYNIKFQSKTNNGFGQDRALLSNIKFLANIIVDSISERTVRGRTDSDEPHTYWSIRDEHGAYFSVHDQNIVQKIFVGDKVLFSGNVKVAKGGTFLNVRSVENGREIPVKYESDEYYSEFVERCSEAGCDELIHKLNVAVTEKNWEQCFKLESRLANIERNNELDSEGLPY